MIWESDCSDCDRRSRITLVFGDPTDRPYTSDPLVRVVFNNSTRQKPPCHDSSLDLLVLVLLGLEPIIIASEVRRLIHEAIGPGGILRHGKQWGVYKGRRQAVRRAVGGTAVRPAATYAPQRRHICSSRLENQKLVTRSGFVEIWEAEIGDTSRLGPAECQKSVAVLGVGQLDVRCR